MDDNFESEMAGSGINIQCRDAQWGAAANSLKHGLTAKTAMPESLRLRVEGYRQSLCDESRNTRSRSSRELRPVTKNWPE